MSLQENLALSPKGFQDESSYRAFITCKLMSLVFISIAEQIYMPVHKNYYASITPSCR